MISQQPLVQIKKMFNPPNTQEFHLDLSIINNYIEMVSIDTKYLSSSTK
jgi:hypothetical protein